MPSKSLISSTTLGFPGGSVVKNLPVIQESQEIKRCRFDPCVGKILWRRK